MAKTNRNKGKKPSKCKHTNKTIKSSSNGIDKSQRLLQSTTITRTTRKQTVKKVKREKVENEVYHKCNKPMPPLSELEQMYESDEDTLQPTSVGIKVDSIEQEQNISIVHSGGMTQTTAKKYADEILKIIDYIEMPKSQSIMPMKKKTKTEVPYIVGCTERPYIPEKPNCNVFKGDNYGITSKTNVINADENQDETLQTPGFYMNSYSLTNSVFNAQANEIASTLISRENNPPINDSDSNDTVIYELNSARNRFSPEPSTSKDSETILKNHQKFIESLLIPEISKDDADNNFEQNNIKAVENKHYNTSNSGQEIDLNLRSDQTNQLYNGCKMNSKNFDNCPYDEYVEIVDEPYTTENMKTRLEDSTSEIEVKNKPTYVKSKNNKNNNLDIVLPILDNEHEMKHKTVVNMNSTKGKKALQTNSPAIVESYNPLDPKVIAEVDLTDFDIDDLITENLSLINKYSEKDIARTVTIEKPKLAEPVAVTNTNIHKNVTNMKLENKKQTSNNGAMTDALTNFNNNNILKIITTGFFDNKRFSNTPNHKPDQLSSLEQIFPQLSLNTINEKVKNSTFNHMGQNIIDLTDSIDISENKSISHNQATGNDEEILPLTIINDIDHESRNNTYKQAHTLNSLSLSKRTLPGPIDEPMPNKKQKTSNIKNNVSTPSQALSLGTCPICLDALSKETIGSTNCGHLFCMPCIETALKSKPKRCPSCRKKVTGQGYHPIFM